MNICLSRGLIHKYRPILWHKSQDHGYKLDVQESVHRDTIMKVTNNMQLYSLIHYS